MDANAVASLTDLIGILQSNPQVFVGIIVTVVSDFLNRDVPKQERFFVVFTACVVIAVIQHFHELAFMNVVSFLVSLAIILAESQVVYHLWFKKLYLREKLQELLHKEAVGIPERAKAV